MHQVESHYRLRITINHSQEQIQTEKKFKQYFLPCKVLLPNTGSDSAFIEINNKKNTSPHIYIYRTVALPILHIKKVLLNKKNIYYTIGVISPYLIYPLYSLSFFEKQSILIKPNLGHMRYIAENNQKIISYLI